MFRGKSEDIGSILHLLIHLLRFCKNNRIGMGSNFLELAACRYGPGAHITEVSAKVEASPWN